MQRHLTLEDLIMIISIGFNALGALGLLVVCDVRFTYWRQQRRWRKAEAAKQYNARNPVYGVEKR